MNPKHAKTRFVSLNMLPPPFPCHAAYVAACPSPPGLVVNAPAKLRPLASPGAHFRASLGTHSGLNGPCPRMSQSLSGDASGME